MILHVFLEQFSHLYVSTIFRPTYFIIKVRWSKDHVIHYANQISGKKIDFPYLKNLIILLTLSSQISISHFCFSILNSYIQYHVSLEGKIKEFWGSKATL